MTALRKALVIIYLSFLGLSWLQLIWFFGYPSVGGFVLTPSAHPYIPPFSVVITRPSADMVCNGWAVKMVAVNWMGFKMHLPVVHYFARVGHTTYEYFNYYMITDNVWNNLANYFYRIVDPKWVAMQYNGPCVADVVAVVPTPIVIIVMAVALTTTIYYRGKRVW
jgi:hypothetical protein